MRNGKERGFFSRGKGHEQITTEPKSIAKFVGKPSSLDGQYAICVGATERGMWAMDLLVLSITRAQGRLSELEDVSAVCIQRDYLPRSVRCSGCSGESGLPAIRDVGLSVGEIDKLKMRRDALNRYVW